MSGLVSYAGLRVVESDLLVEEPTPDWSQCRSPSRAQRRWRKRGIIGRMRFVSRPKMSAYQIGDTLYMHPALAAQLRASIPPWGLTR